MKETVSLGLYLRLLMNLTTEFGKKGT